MTQRVGMGTDVHKLSPGVPMWVAGLHFPDEQAIIGELCVLAFGELLPGAPLFE